MAAGHTGDIGTWAPADHDLLPARPARTPAGAGSNFLYFTRVWAAAKMASLLYTTWWLLGMAHSTPATKACALGSACYFAAVGGRWRRRWFGPGQLLEPELYEDVSRWAVRVGTAVIMAGGLLYVAALAR